MPDPPDSKAFTCPGLSVIFANIYFHVIVTLLPFPLSCSSIRPMLHPADSVEASSRCGIFSTHAHRWQCLGVPAVEGLDRSLNHWVPCLESVWFWSVTSTAESSEGVRKKRPSVWLGWRSHGDGFLSLLVCLSQGEKISSGGVSPTSSATCMSVCQKC